jgi:hypothetical protein
MCLYMMMMMNMTGTMYYCEWMFTQCNRKIMCVCACVCVHACVCVCVCIHPRAHVLEAYVRECMGYSQFLAFSAISFPFSFSEPSSCVHWFKLCPTKVEEGHYLSVIDCFVGVAADWNRKCHYLLSILLNVLYSERNLTMSLFHITNNI